MSNSGDAGTAAPRCFAPTETVSLRCVVNGRTIERQVAARLPLVDFLRDELGLTGTHVGCAHGVCGACTIRVDGRIARGCLMLTAQADGSTIETIEGASDTGALEGLQTAFLTHNAAQCGFCTPGMLLTAAELLEADPTPDRDTIRDAISGNLCRCTGYQAIVDAIAAAATGGGGAQ